MARFRGKYRIESTRLRDWDYGRAGWYFVTICTGGRVRFFGEVANQRVLLSEVGQVAHRFWKAIPDHFPYAALDAFVIMPDHVHGIIGIRSGCDPIARGHHRTPCRDVACNVSTAAGGAWKDPAFMSDISPRSHSLGVIVRSYKSSVSRWARRNGHPEFAWQPRYYEHIIRNGRALRSIRTYIRQNPARI